MRTTRTPLRITLGGGGSDLRDGEGICIAATIDRYVTISVAEEWTNEYVLHYAESERVPERHMVKHRIFRDAFERLDVGPCQVSSVADVPAGTGLGNSGAFTVGLLKALRPEWSHARLAREACALDIGQQDQWSAVYGGLNVYDFREGTIRPIETTVGFDLYYTGMKHDAAEILTGPGKAPARARVQADRMVWALEANDPGAVGFELNRQWEHKFEAAPTPAHQKIDALIAAGIKAGAYGGKLVGAGEGGFILFAVDNGTVRLTNEGSTCV